MILGHMIYAFAAWRRYRACVRELSQLTDRELADIGLTRSAIHSVAWRTNRRLGLDMAAMSRADAFEDR